MKIQPILPVGAMLAFFGILFGATAYFIIRNKLNTWEKIFSLMRMTLIYLLMLTIGLRPALVETKYEFETKNLDVLFVIDNTISMWAQDYSSAKKPRMEGVVKDAEYILSELAGSNFGLVTFDDTAHVLSPYTQDMQYIKDLIDTFKAPDSYYAKGSDLSIPYHDIEALLRSSAKKENRKTIVFYISDGEITNGKELVDYSDFAQYINAGAVLGYGTAEGGKMKEGSYGNVYDYNTHKDAVSCINEDNLKTIAEDLGVSYINLNSGNASLMGTVEIIKESSKTIIENGDGAEVYKDLYYFFAIPLALMLLVEIYYMFRKGRL
ncbi:MAG: VWA domain-containing protein [Butyrivibrio sp.]|nr:VWA domain-containing protein [Butyrivibrio sp.]